MNRLILIGNGFDLAHGMKTSYSEFILSHVKQAFQKCLMDGHYEDDLMTVKKMFSFTGWRRQMETLDDFIPFLVASKSKFFVSTAITSSYEDTEEGLPIEWKIKNEFVQRLIQCCQSCGWVEIELEYYDELKRIIAINDQSKKDKEIKALNTSFQALKESLEEYLHVIPKPNLLSSYEVIFGEQNPNYKCLFVNFNYTNILDNFVNSHENYAINYIHGRLKDVKNPMIFGYGDDLDETYRGITQERSGEFRRFAKSFSYNLTSNYRELNTFLGTRPFQVSVMGLSCGLSDRTLLHAIFEHEHCRDIKIFYYKNSNGNNFMDVSQQIARHFNSTHLFRMRIVPFPRLRPMPQLTS